MHAGYPCLVRMGYSGLEGYVELPAGHPWLQAVPDDQATGVHGGITYQRGCIIGFDTWHQGDATHPDSKAAAEGVIREGRQWSWCQVADEAERLARRARIAQDRYGLAREPKALHIPRHAPTRQRALYATYMEGVGQLDLDAAKPIIGFLDHKGLLAPDLATAAGSDENGIWWTAAYDDDERTLTEIDVCGDKIRVWDMPEDGAPLTAAEVSNLARKLLSAAHYAEHHNRKG